MTVAVQSPADLRVDIKVHERAVEDAAYLLYMAEEPKARAWYREQHTALSRHLKRLRSQLAEAEHQP